MILSLAILTGAIAVLGELARLGMRSARYARQMTQAQLLCESKMAQISSGMILPQAEAGVPFVAEDLIDPYDPVTWVYTIKPEPVEESGMVAVRVTVAQELPTGQHPVRFSLVRWIVDPGVEVEEVLPEQSNEEGSTLGSSSSKSPTDVSGGSGSSSGGDSEDEKQ